MFTKLIPYLADVIVLCIKDCEFIVGFQEFIRNIVKIFKIDTAYEEKEDVLVRKITTEA